MAGARVHIENFGGEIPRRGDRLLPNTFAADARNMKLESGEIRALRYPKLIHDFNDKAVVKAYRLPDPTPQDPDRVLWVGFDSLDAHLVRGALVEDKYNRFYLFGVGKPKYTTLDRLRADPTDFSLLGVPKPTPKPRITGEGTGTETRSYVYIWVSSYGEEGPPSDPVTATGDPGATWRLEGFANPPAGYNIEKIHVYRTVTGQASGEYYFVGEAELVDQYFSDVAVAPENNRILEAEFNFPPKNLEGVVVMPRGFLVGWIGRTVYLSKQNLPHAWPQIYDKATEYDVIGGGTFGNSAALVTKGNPYVLTGTNPAGVTMANTNTVEPGLSKHSIVSFINQVVYASQNGMVSIGPQGVTLISRDLLTRHEWLREFSPETILACQYETSYLAFYASDHGFLVDPYEAQSGLIDLDAFDHVDGIITDPYTGDVFLVHNGQVRLWDDVESPRVEWRWKSKVFTFPVPCNLGAVALEYLGASSEYQLTPLQMAFNRERIKQPLSELGGNVLGGVTPVYMPSPLDNNPQNRNPLGGSPLESVDVLHDIAASIQLIVYAEGRVVFMDWYDEYIHRRLPSGFKAREWQFEMLGYPDMYSLKAAETGKGLRDV